MIVGLGNPGPQYERTPHNLGFRVLDEMAQRHRMSFSETQQGCLVATGQFQGNSYQLIKPARFMNRSGDALQVWAEAYGYPLTGEEPDPVITPLVVCDDISLPLGALRLRDKGSDGGHQGLASIAAALGRDTYPRLRLGVRDTQAEIPADLWADFVLTPFRMPDWERSQELVGYAVDALEFYLLNGLESTKSRFNRRHVEQPPE